MATPELNEVGDEQDEANMQGPALPARRLTRWVFLGIAGSAAVATAFLFYTIKSGLVWPFERVALLAVLIGVGVPALLTMLAGNRLLRHGMRPERIYVAVCATLLLVHAVILI